MGTQKDLFFAASPSLRAAASLSFCACRYCALAVCLLCVISLAMAGCVYNLAGTGGRAPGDIQSIAVDKLQNRTTEVGIETVFTNALLNQFIRWKRLEVKSSSEAEAVLGGSIAGIRTQQFSHLTDTRTLQSRVTITLALTLTRADTDEILWQNKSLSYFDEYVEAPDALTTDRLRREAISRIAVFLAEKVHQDIFEGF